MTGAACVRESDAGNGPAGNGVIDHLGGLGNSFTRFKEVGLRPKKKKAL